MTRQKFNRISPVFQDDKYQKKRSDEWEQKESLQQAINRLFCQQLRFMSFTYREIKQEKHLAETVWAIEETFPRWFKAASHVWTPTREAFLDFWDNSKEIYGLFNENDLIACVYLEYKNEKTVNIHISVIRRICPAELVRFFLSLKRMKMSEGVTDMFGWLLEKNRFLIKLAANADFYPTGLRMDTVIPAVAYLDGYKCAVKRRWFCKQKK